MWPISDEMRNRISALEASLTKTLTLEGETTEFSPTSQSREISSDSQSMQASPASQTTHLSPPSMMKQLDSFGVNTPSTVAIDPIASLKRIISDSEKLDSWDHFLEFFRQLRAPNHINQLLVFAIEEKSHNFLKFALTSKDVIVPKDFIKLLYLHAKKLENAEAAFIVLCFNSDWEFSRESNHSKEQGLQELCLVKDFYSKNIGKLRGYRLTPILYAVSQNNEFAFEVLFREYIKMYPQHQFEMLTAIFATAIRFDSGYGCLNSLDGQQLLKYVETNPHINGLNLIDFAQRHNRIELAEKLKKFYTQEQIASPASGFGQQFQRSKILSESRNTRATSTYTSFSKAKSSKEWKARNPVKKVESYIKAIRVMSARDKSEQLDYSSDIESVFFELMSSGLIQMLSQKEKLNCYKELDPYFQHYNDQEPKMRIEIEIKMDSLRNEVLPKVCCSIL